MTTFLNPEPAVEHGEAEQYVDGLVDRWDELINWSGRTDGERGFFAELLRTHGAHRVLDAATGTGFHALTLHDAGFDVVAADASESMIRRTRQNARARGYEIEAVVSDWRQLGGAVDGTFDAIVCLGSSFPHLFEESDRRLVLEQFHACLRPGGTLIVDHRNFDAIRAHVYGSRGRFYYTGADVSVSVASVDEHACTFRYRFADVTHHLRVYPLLCTEIRSLLGDAGFTDVRTYGDFEEIEDVLDADFLIQVARKPEEAA